MTDLYFRTLRSLPRALLQSAGLGVMPKEHGGKALILASNNGNVKVVRLLLNDEEVDVNFQDNDGATALYYASHNGHLKVVRALLKHPGVDVNIQDNDGDTALLLASEKGHLEVVCALLNHDGVNVNIQDNDGKTALIVASEFGHVEVVHALLNHEGVNVNIQDNDARTALIWARRKGHSEVVRSLLGHNGVDVNVSDKYGYTALKVARMRPEDCAAHLLLEENMKRVKLLEEKNPAGTGAKHLEPRYPPRRNENSSSNDDTKVEEQEEERKLRKVETSWTFFKVVSDTAVGLQYWRSRQKTKVLLSSMSEIEKKMQAMQEIDDEILDIDDKVEAAKRRQATLMQKRAALIEKPDTWSASDEILVEVLPNDPQYWAVCNRLRGAMSDAHVSKLWRIQNNSLWTYYSFRRDLLEMNGVEHNEKSVWHGTSSVDPSAIYNDRQDGFMMQYSQSGLWGRGIYFAEKSSYSYSYAYQPSLGSAGLPSTSLQRPGAVNDEREMFLTKLLVGKEVQMNRDESPQKAAECKKLIIPPVDPTTNLKYNTVTGYSAGSQVWVVYENGRAYPDYLVRYYRGSRDQNRTPFENEREVAPDVEMGNSVEFIWEYFDDNSWKAYADHHQVLLETAFQFYTVNNSSSSSIVRISTKYWEYEVDFAAMQQRNIQHPSHRQRSVQRRLKNDPRFV